jgi:uncharacterized membrane protein
MKSILLFIAFLLFGSVVFAQNKKQTPPSWGHYKKLETFSPGSIKEMEAFDTLCLVLESGRLLAYQLVKRLMTNEAFKKDFAAAKAEIEKVKTSKGF